MLWAASDYQGTIRDWMKITSSDVHLVEHVSYDAFGEIESIKDGNGSSVEFSDRDAFFAYTGRLYDPATELQNNLNRWYDPKAGRWISEDPIGFAAGDANLYRYVGNEPTGWVDPDGKSKG